MNLTSRKRAASCFEAMQGAVAIYKEVALSYCALKSAILLSRHLLGQQVREGLLPFSGRLCHAFKNDWRALYRRRFTGTVNLPSPWLRRARSSLYGKRIISWVKFFIHGRFKIAIVVLIFQL